MRDKRPSLVIALYPNARGFAYVIFEGPHCLVDWGTGDVLQKEGRVSACVRRISDLIDRYSPEYLALREISEAATSAARAIVPVVEEVAGRKGVPTYHLSRKDIQAAFAHLESPTRYAIAQAIAQQIRILAPLMPSPRKIWNGENGRMGLFDAAALALAFFGTLPNATA